MSLPFLRPGLEGGDSFGVDEVPARAKLDQNECPLDVPGELKERLLAALREAPWNRYPQPAEYQRVKRRFAEALGEPPGRVVLTVGCDQVILLAFWAAGGQGRTARVFEPAYPMYAHYARVTGTDLDRVVLGADFDVAARGLGGPVDLLALVRPNNPTGGGPERALVLEALARDGLVLVDEAYQDFAGGDTVADLGADHPNLLVGRSLSKALVAGVRLGYALGHPEVVALCERLLFAPYHLNALQLVVAEHFAELMPALEAMAARVCRERERVSGALRGLGLRVWPSRGNFVLFAVDDAARTYRALLGRGVRIRDVSGVLGLSSHLRTTIGSAGENDLFLEALAASL